MKFSIDTKPISKGRPRFSRSGFAYTPSKTLEYEKVLRAHAIAVGCRPKSNPCIVTIDCHFKRPKVCKEFYCTINRDVDNLGKAILDAMNGVLFDDDKQVCQLTVSKNWAEKDSIDIEIEYL